MPEIGIILVYLVALKPTAGARILSCAKQYGSWADIGTDENNFIEVPENGIILVYLSNQSVANVFFDNLVVSMEAGSLLEERHYYPYGLPIQGWGSTAAGSLSNRQLYQGNEYRQEAGLN